MSAKQYKATGEDVWKNRTEKVVRTSHASVRCIPTISHTLSRNILPCDTQSGELFTMTYGALVIQLIKDYQDYAEVNKQLERM